MVNAIQIESLTKKFGDCTAVDGISLEIDSDEIFGFLGPNGAGKSTTMMILTTLLKPTSGRALVCGHDVQTSPSKVRQNIGYVQQESTVDEFLTGRENLQLEARMNHIPGDLIDERIDDLLTLIELQDKQHDAVLTYSGGMRKRLDIAGGLLHMPKVLFLDEPTVGLDIQTRRKIWEYIGRIHKEYGMTIFVSTHYMEEADSLCDRVAIIDGGRIQAVDSPSEMKAALGNEVITLHVAPDASDRLVQAIRQIQSVSDINAAGGEITVFTSNGTAVIPEIFALSTSLDAKIDSISLKQPSLDDVFISYTGHQLRDDEGAPARRRRPSKRW